MSTDVHSLPDDPQKLKALLAERERMIAQREQVIEQYETTLSETQRKLKAAEHQISQLLKRITGSRQERIDPDQLTLFSIDELTEIAAQLSQGDPDEPLIETDLSRGKRRRRLRHGRRQLPEHLPREQVVYELTEQERRCSCCGEVRQEIGRQSSEQLEYVPASLKVIEHVRVKYACASCQENVVIADKPRQPIDKGLPGAGMLAHTVLSKYGDHMPLYRQEDISARLGLLIRRSTLCGWIAAAADLARPLYDRMCQLVLHSKVVHTDDTAVKLLSAQARQGPHGSVLGLHWR